MDAELLIPLQRHLEGLGLLEVVEQDPSGFGDNLVSLTRRAEELLSRGRGSIPELLEILNPERSF
jgi:hypothetical protein